MLAADNISISRNYEVWEILCKDLIALVDLPSGVRLAGTRKSDTSHMHKPDSALSSANRNVHCAEGL